MDLSEMSISPHRFGDYLSMTSPSVPLMPAILLLSPNLELLEQMTAKQIPPTLNRIYDLIHHEGTNSGLNFAGCLVLPFRGGYGMAVSTFHFVSHMQRAAAILYL
jgi:hypothetical protein